MRSFYYPLAVIMDPVLPELNRLYSIPRAIPPSCEGWPAESNLLYWSKLLPAMLSPRAIILP